MEVWCVWLKELDAISAEVPAESAHTSSRKSARNARIELNMCDERRRRWTIEQKQTIAAQPAPGDRRQRRRANTASAAGSCIHGGMRCWRQPEAVTHTSGRFARIEVKATRTVEHVCQKAAIEASSAVPELLADPTAQPSGRIEIVLTDGTAVRMEGHFV